MSSLNRDWKRCIALLCQLSAHGVDPFGRPAGDVFDNNPFRAHCFNNSKELIPKPALSTFKANSLASGAEVCAREPAANKVNCLWLAIALSCKFFDIAIPFHIWPVLCQYLVTVLIILNLPHHWPESSPFKAQFETTSQMPENSDPMVNRSGIVHRPFYE
jgi:hypothetical protein